MITGLDHIAIAVPNLDQAIQLWQSALGAMLNHREIVASQKVEIAMITFGELRIELVAPTSEDSPIAKYLASRGPGIHHIALSTPSTPRELARLESAGVKLIDRKARVGAGGTHVGFLHPRSLGGVLVELVDHSEEPSESNAGSSA